MPPRLFSLYFPSNFQWSLNYSRVYLKQYVRVWYWQRKRWLRKWMTFNWEVIALFWTRRWWGWDRALTHCQCTAAPNRGSRFNCCVSLWHLSHTVKGQKTPQSTRRCCGAALTGTGGKLVTSHARKLTPVPVCQACLLPRLPALFSLQKQGELLHPTSTLLPKAHCWDKQWVWPQLFCPPLV